MQKAIMYYEWIIWFRDGNVILQHKLDGTEVTWKTVLKYANSNSQITRAGFIPFTPDKAEKASQRYKIEYDEQYEADFETLWEKQIFDFVVPIKPTMEDKGIKRNQKKFDNAMLLYNNARKIPMDRQEFRRVTYKWRNNCVAKLIPSHFIEVRLGDIPFVFRRLVYGYYGGNQHITYYYILGAGGRKVKDSKDRVHYVDGYYQAIDNNGHTRLCHYSNVVVPIIPPEASNDVQLEVIEIE